MADDQKEANYTRPPTQDFAELVQSDEYVPPGVVASGSEQEGSTNGYVGTDPIYQNHANDTEAPIQADPDENPEAALMETEYADDVDFSLTDPPEGVGDEVDTDETTTSPGSPSTSSSSSSTSSSSSSSGGSNTPPSSSSGS